MLRFDSSPFVIPLGILAWGPTSPGKNKRKSTLGVTLGRTASPELASLTRLSAIRWVAVVGNHSRWGARSTGGQRVFGNWTNKARGCTVNQQFYKNMALWVVILVGMLMLFTMLRQDQETPPDLAYSDFVIAVEDGQIEEITIEEGSISGIQIDGGEFTTYAPTISQDLLALLKEKQIKT